MIFRRLVRAGSRGMNSGRIAQEFGLPPSTLTHHLAALASSGLVLQERRGRETITRADYDAMERLVGFLTRECCADEAGTGNAP